MWFALLFLLSFPACANEISEFEYSRFFHAKDLVKEALEKESLKAAKHKKTKELQNNISSSLTASLLSIRTALKNNIDFAVISNEMNNNDELLEKDIMFITVKLKYTDEKGSINWELTSVVSPREIDFFSVVDDQKELGREDLYVYKRLYKQ